MKQSLTAAALAVGAIATAAAASAKDVTIPKGTYLELKSASAFDSEHATRGDTFTATVIRGLWVDGQLAIPSGSTVLRAKRWSFSSYLYLLWLPLGVSTMTHHCSSSGS